MSVSWIMRHRILSLEGSCIFLWTNLSSRLIITFIATLIVSYLDSTWISSKWGVSATLNLCRKFFPLLGSFNQRIIPYFEGFYSFCPLNSVYSPFHRMSLMIFEGDSIFSVFKYLLYYMVSRLFTILVTVPVRIFQTMFH